MSQARQLYELQEVDLGLDGRRQALAQVESQLGDSEALLTVRRELEAEAQLMAQLESEQRDGEWEVDDLQHKIASLQTKLYSGEVKSPKELTSLQEEVKHLEARRISLEDRVLETMARLEAMRDSVKEKSNQLAEMDEEWCQRQQGLASERVGLKAELAALEQRRSSLIVSIEPQSLELYVLLRERKHGRAVAKVEQGMCQGCRINLPLADLQRTRASGELVQCSNCGRILYIR